MKFTQVWRVFSVHPGAVLLNYLSTLKVVLCEELANTREPDVFEIVHGKMGEIQQKKKISIVLDRERERERENTKSVELDCKLMKKA
jgi:hypothetical protein